MSTLTKTYARLAQELSTHAQSFNLIDFQLRSKLDGLMLATSLQIAQTLKIRLETALKNRIAIGGNRSAMLAFIKHMAQIWQS